MLALHPRQQSTNATLTSKLCALGCTIQAVRLAAGHAIWFTKSKCMQVIGCRLACSCADRVVPRLTDAFSAASSAVSCVCSISACRRALSLQRFSQSVSLTIHCRGGHRCAQISNAHHRHSMCRHQGDVLTAPLHNELCILGGESCQGVTQRQLGALLLVVARRAGALQSVHNLGCRLGLGAKLSVSIAVPADAVPIFQVLQSMSAVSDWLPRSPMQG